MNNRPENLHPENLRPENLHPENLRRENLRPESSHSESLRVGFIGLGNMGKPMAERLVAAGHDVCGYDLTPVDIVGMEWCSSAAEAVKGREIVVTMLPNADISLGVCRQILPSMDPNSIYIDCSTIDVASSKLLAQRASDAAIQALDAPVSGGVNGAVAGTLTFMVGGSAAAFEQAQPVFSLLGQRAVLCGDHGSGQGVKICNNLILGINMIGTCEALALGEALGLDAEALFSVVNSSSGKSWVTDTYFPVPGVGPISPADRDYKPGFSADLMLKDLLLSRKAALEAGQESELGDLATAIYKRFVTLENGAGKDFSALLPKLRNRL